MPDLQKRALRRLDEFKGEGQSIDRAWMGTQRFREWLLKVEIELEHASSKDSIYSRRFRDLQWPTPLGTPTIDEERAWTVALESAVVIINAAITGTREFPFAMSGNATTTTTLQALAIEEVHHWPRPLRILALTLGVVVVSGFAVWSSLPASVKEQLLSASGYTSAPAPKPPPAGTTAPGMISGKVANTGNSSASGELGASSSPSTASHLQDMIGTWTVYKKGDVLQQGEEYNLILSVTEYPSQLSGSMSDYLPDDSGSTIAVDATTVDGREWVELGRMIVMQPGGNAGQGTVLLNERYLVVWRAKDTFELRNNTNVTLYVLDRKLKSH